MLCGEMGRPSVILVKYALSYSDAYTVPLAMNDKRRVANNPVTFPIKNLFN